MSKFKGIERMDYHEILTELELYSRERYMVIYAWQQRQGIKENLEERVIKSARIPWNILEMHNKKYLRSRQERWRASSMVCSTTVEVYKA